MLPLRRSKIEAIAEAGSRAMIMSCFNYYKKLGVIEEK